MKMYSENKNVQKVLKCLFNCFLKAHPLKRVMLSKNIFNNIHSSRNHLEGYIFDNQHFQILVF